jgi:hypothetical protein
MLKSPFGAHCMQCKDGCQGVAGRNLNPIARRILFRVRGRPVGLWLAAFATSCRALKRSLGLCEAVVGICSRGLWEQDQVVVEIAPPAWYKKPRKLLHHPATPESWVSAEAGWNHPLAQSLGAQRWGGLEVFKSAFCVCRESAHAAWRRVGHPACAAGAAR